MSTNDVSESEEIYSSDDEELDQYYSEYEESDEGEDSETEIQNVDSDTENFEDLYSVDDPTEITNTNTSITTPFITKYELVKVKALRVQMLENHAPPTVEASLFPNNEYPRDTEEIAMMELKHKKLPFIIRRPLPNGLYEDIPVSRLLIRDSF
jgi:DNA-directed RNA polymerase I, II, and III subunit RPABC2